MSWPTDITVEEAVYQALAASDALATAQIASAPDHRHETEIAWAIGREPSGGSVAAWFGGMGVAHFLLTGAMLHWGHPALARAFEGISIGFEGETVAWNVRVGAKF